MTPAVFLDRDDTLIANHALGSLLPHPGYLYDPALVKLLPGVPDACRELHSAGFMLVMVTNQSAPARGMCRIEDVERTNQRVRDLLASAGVPLAGVYTSTYTPDATFPAFASDHPWRKPRGGMLRAAASDLMLDISRSWMIGDARRDIEAAVDAGIALQRTIIVGTHACERVGHRAMDLREAANVVLRGAPGAQS